TLCAHGARSGCQKRSGANDFASGPGTAEQERRAGALSKTAARRMMVRRAGSVSDWRKQHRWRDAPSSSRSRSRLATETEASMPRTLGEVQNLIRDLYGAKDAQRGVDGTFMWFMQEVGELATALRGGDH